MSAEIYWVREIEPLRLGIMARPRAGDWLPDEVAGWVAAGVAVVVSLLQENEVAELGLSHEPGLCRDAGIRFLSHAIPDRGVPERADDFLTLAAQLAAEVRGGAGVAIHCRAGIGRSGLLGAAVLRELEIPVTAGFAMLSRPRGVSVPDTEVQRDWLAAQRLRVHFDP